MLFSGCWKRLTNSITVGNLIELWTGKMPWWGPGHGRQACSGKVNTTVVLLWSAAGGSYLQLTALLGKFEGLTKGKILVADLFRRSVKVNLNAWHSPRLHNIYKYSHNSRALKTFKAFLGGTKELACQHRRLWFDPCIRKIPWHGSPFQHSCLENPHGQRILAGYGP